MTHSHSVSNAGSRGPVASGFSRKIKVRQTSFSAVLSLRDVTGRVAGEMRRLNARAKRERATLQRIAPDGLGRGEPRHGGGVQASRDALVVHRARRETEAGGGSDAALPLRRARRMGSGVPSPHVVTNLLGSLLEHCGAPRAALRRPPARALIGRQAPGRRPPAPLSRGWSLVRLRGVTAPAPRRRQERDRRGIGVTRRRVRRQRRLT